MYGVFLKDPLLIFTPDCIAWPDLLLDELLFKRYPSPEIPFSMPCAQLLPEAQGMGVAAKIS